MSNLSKILLIFIFTASLALAVVAGQNIKEGSDKDTVPARDRIEINEPVEDKSNEVFCTMDIKICPDGTEVSRDPINNCEFKSCPGEVLELQTEEAICGNDICEETEVSSCSMYCRDVNGKRLCTSETCKVDTTVCPQDCNVRKSFTVKPAN